MKYHLKSSDEGEGIQWVEAVRWCRGKGIGVSERGGEQGFNVIAMEGS